MSEYVEVVRDPRIDELTEALRLVALAPEQQAWRLGPPFDESALDRQHHAAEIEDAANTAHTLASELYATGALTASAHAAITRLSIHFDDMNPNDDSLWTDAAVAAHPAWAAARDLARHALAEIEAI